MLASPAAGGQLCDDWRTAGGAPERLQLAPAGATALVRRLEVAQGQTRTRPGQKRLGEQTINRRQSVNVIVMVTELCEISH